jgi:hypothetical protein
MRCATAVRNSIVEEGSAFTKASQNFRIIEGHEPKGRGKAFTVLDDAVGRGRARIRLLLRVIGGQWQMYAR